MKEFDEMKNLNDIEKKLQTNLSKDEIISKAFQYHLQGNIAEASKYYQFFINQGFKDHRIFLNSGEILKDLGRLEEAEIWMRRAISLKPDYIIAHNNLGNILRAKNKLKEAESCYLKAIKLNPDFTKAYYNLSTLTSTDENKIWEPKLFSESFLKNKSKNDQFIILNLWASWCIPCENEVSELKIISETEGYSVIGILVEDSAENGREFIQKNNISYQNVLDSTIADSILIQFIWSGIPTTLVLDNNLEIIFTINGEITANEIFEITR